MKVNMTVDLTPEEARKLLGLPDVEHLQQEMTDLMRAKMLENIQEMSDPEVFFKKVFPVGAESLEQFQKMFTDFATKSPGSDREGS